MTGFGNRELLRLRYGQGQTVRSADFREKHRVEGELRAWHNRALHNAYGIAKGVLQDLEVKPLADNSGVTVASGLAFDCFGRELQLRQTTAIKFPEAKEPALLLLSYGSPPNFQSPRDSTVCFTTGQGLPSTATLSWISLKDFTVHDGVPLAQTRIVGTTVSVDPGFHTLQARALARPRIASGNTIAGLTKWEQWDPHRNFFDGLIGYMQVRIDTSSAGFTRVPAYFAWLDGPINDFDRKIFTFHFDHVDEVTPNGFVFRLALMIIPADINNFPDQRRFFEERAYVNW